MLFCVFYCGEQAGCVLLGNSPGRAVRSIQDSSHGCRKDPRFQGVMLGASLPNDSARAHPNPGAAPGMSRLLLQHLGALPALRAELLSAKCVHSIGGQMLLQKYRRLIPCAVPFT